METTKLSTLDKWLSNQGNLETIQGDLAAESKALIVGMEFHTYSKIGARQLEIGCS
jgi:hypothetical protein